MINPENGAQLLKLLQLSCEPTERADITTFLGDVVDNDDDDDDNEGEESRDDCDNDEDDKEYNADNALRLDLERAASRISLNTLLGSRQMPIFRSLFPPPFLFVFVNEEK